MSRSLRIAFPGAVYHIGARGYEKSYIFRDDREKQHLLDILAAAGKIFDFVVHAYTIMGNHYHILAATTRPELSRIMHYINMRYAKYYNTRHNRKGYVFERRYKAFIIQKGEAVKRQVQYIHMNPLRAKLELKLGEYRWTSHNKYIGLDKTGPAECDYVLSLFGTDTKTAIPAYEEYMSKSRVLNKFRVEKGIYGVGIIGDRNFVQQVKLWAANRELPEEINRRSEFRKVFEADDIIKAAVSYYGVSAEVLCSKKGAWNSYKKVMIYLLSKDGGLYGAQIARLVGIHTSAVSKSISRLEKQMQIDNKITREINKIRDIYMVFDKALIK